MITPQVGAEGIRKALAILREAEPTVTKDLKADLRGKLSNIAKQTAEAVPTSPPLSGFGSQSPTGWSRVSGIVSVTPGKSRVAGNHLVSIRVRPQGARRGLFIAELAGSRSGGQTPAGRNLIRVLNQRFPMQGRGGRFAYNKFRLLRPDAVRIAIGIVNRTVQKIDKRLGI
jgi:hypothetical protein